MKVSINTIRQYVDFDPLATGVDGLVARINEQLGQVEEVIDLRAVYKDAVIVKVVEAEQHPDADRLRVCKVDDGGVVADVPRDDNGYVQVVCGAPNAVAGMHAVWLPPASTVPASFSDDEPFVLSARELRGVLSQGMLAAADELAIGSDHEGIIEITEKDIKPQNPQSGEPFYRLVAGASFAEVFGLDDVVMDMENKMFTHRPDCFGQIGVAREIAGIFGQKFTSPEWYWDLPDFASGEGLKLELFNDAPEKVPRFMAVAIKDVTVAPSPLWLQCELVRLGGKPINNIVDATNYVMLLTAQPTHAYDYDKLRGGQLGARMAKAGEKATLLNGKTYQLDETDIVIADGEGVIGLAGIMGGGNSEVSADTKNIVLEVANFDMYTLRKSSMRHGVFTDALTRFNKGQSPLQNDRVMDLLLNNILASAGGQQASPVLDDRTAVVEAVYDDQSLSGELSITPDFINQRLGSDLSFDDIQLLLSNVEIAAAEEGGSLSVTAPYWRTDIELPEDVVEEVGRLYGFDKLPRTLPLRSGVPAPYNLDFTTKQKVRTSLARGGANELLTYSFVHERVLKTAGQDAAKAFRLGNALSPDLQYYRLSLLPSLLDKVHGNIKAGYDEFALFEIGKAHHKDEYDNDGLPREFGRIAGVYASKKAGKGAAYYHAKRLVEQTLKDSGIGANVRYEPLTNFDFGQHDAFRQLAAPFDPERSATIWLGKQLGGVVGEFARSTSKGFKLPDYTAGFELFQSLVTKNASSVREYTPLSRFPSTSQDISLKHSAGTAYGDVLASVETALAESAGNIRYSVKPVTIYQASGNVDSKTTTFRITFTHSERTLIDSDIAPIIHAIATATSAELGATQV